MNEASQASDSQSYDQERLCGLLGQECSYQLDGKLMRRFLDGGHVIGLHRNEILTTAGMVDTNLYIVIEGIMRNWYYDGDREVTSYFSMDGTLFTAYYSFYCNRPAFYNVEACCPTTCLCIPRSHYFELFNTSHEFCKWFLTMANCQLFFYEYKDSVINSTARERYIALLKKRPEILRKVSLSVIASYLKITPQYLSRLRKMKL